MGEHKSHDLYTIGQRARVAGLSEPYYVVGKENDTNTVLLVRNEYILCFDSLFLVQARERDNHALYTHRFTTAVPSWIAGTPPSALLHDGELTLYTAVQIPQPT